MVLLQADDMSNKTVFLSAVSWDRHTAFCHDIDMAMEFKTESEAKTWYEGHKDRDPKLRDYCNYRLVNITKTLL